MKKVYELKEGDIIRYNFGDKGVIITARVVEIEPYTTWTRLKLNHADKVNDKWLNSSFWTWLNTDAVVEVIGNDKG